MTPTPLRAFAAVLAAAFLALPAALAAGEREVHGISLGEAVTQAIRNNFDIALERVNVEIAREDLTLAESEFDPALNAAVSYQKSRAASTSAFASPEISEGDSSSAEAYVSRKMDTGAEIKAGVTGQQGYTNSTYESLNPSYNTSLKMELAQPLFKNMGEDVNRWRIKTGANNEEIARDRLRIKLSDVITATHETYWDLVFRVMDLKAQKESLERARDLEKRVRIQVEVGALSPLEIVQAQASVAERERLVIEADNSVDRVADQLLRLINPPGDDAIWRKRLNPADSPGMAFPPLDLDRAMAEAIERRPEILAAKKEMENREIELVYRENQKQPSLDLVASLSLNGVRGEAQRVTSISSGGTKTSSFGGVWPDALSDAVSGDFYDYSIGLRFSYPLGARGARAQAASAALSAQAALISLKSLEKQVIIEARDAVREIENGRKRIEAARSARILAEKRLEAETRKFEVGASTSFNVLEYQKDLTLQTSEELRAVTESRKAVVRYYRATGYTLESNALELE